MSTEVAGGEGERQGRGLTVSRLTVTPFEAKAPAISEVSFRLEPGERALLLGPSGAGKSTLLLTISGALQQLESAEISGQVDAPASGLLLQNTADSSVADTVFRDVAFGAESAGIPALTISSLVSQALAEVGLSGIPDQRNPETLSGGELARSCLAGLLTLRPQLLLLDEPTAMLDANSATLVREAVKTYLESSGANAIVAEHFFAGWAPMLDRTLVLDGSGHLIADGPTELVLADQADLLLSWGLWVTEETPEGAWKHPAPALGLEPWPVAAEANGSSPASGKIIALVGPSGSGKTTWLNQALGDAVPSETGWMPQNPLLTIAGETVLKSVLAPELPKVVDKADGGLRGRAIDLLARLGLGDALDQSPHSLSGGQLRRLALATSLLRQPRVLYLDEPTVGQDAHNWVKVTGQVLAARDSGATVYLATHDPLLLEYADEVMTFPQAAAVHRIDAANHNDLDVQKVSGSRGQLPFSPLGLLGASAVTLGFALGFQSVLGACTALILELLVLLALMARYPRLRHPKLFWPVLVGVISVWFSNWWLSANHLLEPAALVALRVAFFGLPGVLLSSAISASSFGDQLGQLLHMPARPVVAGMIGLYRVQRLRTNWANLVLLRRIRGIRQTGPIGGLRELGTLTLLTLVDATRGAQQTAIAMETRGFSATEEEGKPIRRSWAQPATWGRGDAWLLLGAAALGLIGLLVR